MDDFGKLSLLTEHVIDKRGFMYHGDEAEPEEFVRLITTGEYNNTSSMYGKGLYCVRHPQDAAANSYGPYIYKIFVRGLDTFLHLDQLAYNAAFNNSGPKDSQDSELFFDRDLETDQLSWDEESKGNRVGAGSFDETAGGIDQPGYYRFVASQLKRLVPDMAENDIEAVYDMFLDAYSSPSVSKVDYSSDVLKQLYRILVKYGVPGVTYTGRRDRRCCLVYDMSNVYPVAVAVKKGGYVQRGRLVFSPLRPMLSPEMATGLGKYLVKYNHSPRIDTSKYLTQNDMAAKMERLLSQERVGTSRTPEVAKKLLAEYSRLDKSCDWMGDMLYYHCEDCIERIKTGEEVKYVTDTMFKTRRRFFAQMETYAEQVLERLEFTNFGLETGKELLEDGYAKMTSDSGTIYLNHAISQGVQCFDGFRKAIDNVMAVVNLEHNVRVGSTPDFGGWKNIDDAANYYISSSPFSKQAVYRQEEAIRNADKAAMEFKDAAFRAIRRILDGRKEAERYLMSDEFSWSVYARGVFIMCVNECCEKVLNEAMKFVDSKMSKWDAIRSMSGLPGMQGGSGASGSTAAEQTAKRDELGLPKTAVPAPRMESFSGFLSKKRGLRGF